MCCFHVLFCTSMHNCFNYLRLSFHQRAVKTLQVFVKKVSPLCRLQKQDFGIVDVGYTLPLFHTMTLVIKQICYETRNKLKFLIFHSFLFFFVIFGWGGDVLIKSLETAGPIWPWNKLTLTLTHIEYFKPCTYPQHFPYMLNCTQKNTAETCSCSRVRQ